ncbi:unnamed protein product [Phytomonas sp. EM1]|nr:unnamed protein product [Phytomonas sp. EM1]|eukprot:CCW61217.1 unnamed protein product [Phytomonas sp. isolate EM1]
MLGNRFYQKFYLHCGHCKGIQRAAQGYRPIPNPILFDSDAHCRSYHNEQRRANGFVGMRVSCRCEACHRMHSNWTVLDAQQFIDIKLKMSPEDRQRLL